MAHINPSPVQSGTYAPASGSTVYAAQTQAAPPSVMLAAPVNRVSLGPATINAAWTNLDLSAQLPARAVAAVVSIMMRDSGAATLSARLRQNGVTTGGINADGSAGRFGPVSAVSNYSSWHLVVPVDVNRIIQYQLTGSGTAGEFYLDVIGYLPGTLA